MKDQYLYDQVSAEIAQNSIDAGLWTRALSDAGGDENRARARYIRLRVKQLAKERRDAGRKQPADLRSKSQAQRELDPKRGTGGKGIVYTGIGLGGFFIFGGVVLIVQGGEGAVSVLVVGVVIAGPALWAVIRN